MIAYMYQNYKYVYNEEMQFAIANAIIDNILDITKEDNILFYGNSIHNDFVQKPKVLQQKVNREKLKHLTKIPIKSNKIKSISSSRRIIIRTIVKSNKLFYLCQKYIKL